MFNNNKNCLIIKSQIQMQLEQENQGEYRTPNKVFACITMFFQLVVCMVYGFFFKISENDNIVNQPTSFIYIALFLLFIIFGFGLLLASTGKLSYTGLGFTFLFTCITIQAYFLANGFWSKSLIQESVNTFQTRDFPISLSFIQDKLMIGGNLGEALKCALSIIVAMSVLIGRVAPIEMFVISIFGTALYQFTRQVSLKVNGNDFGSMKIFLFGGAFGLGLSLIMMARQRQFQDEDKQNHYLDKHNGALGLLGFIIVVSLFPILTFQSNMLLFQWYTAPLNVIYSIAAAGFTSFLISLISQGYKLLVLGTIAGGVAVLSSSAYIINPVYAIIIGVFSSIIQFFLIKLNRKIEEGAGILDSFGSFIFIFHGFLGCIWVTIHQSISRGNSYDFNFDNAGVEYFKRASVFNFANGWISLLLGLCGGVILGLIMFCLTGNPFLADQYFSDCTFWQKQVNSSIVSSQIQMVTQKKQKKKSVNDKLVEGKKTKQTENFNGSANEIIFKPRKNIQPSRQELKGQNSQLQVNIKDRQGDIKGKNSYL